MAKQNITMEQALAVVEPEHGQEMVPGTPWTRNQAATLVRTIAPGLTPDEFRLFAARCAFTGLDPFVGQIHPVKRNTKTGPKLTIQTGIDGLRLIAHRTGQCAGIGEADFVYEEGSDQPVSARVVVKRIVQGIVCEFVGTARWREFYPGEKQGHLWRQMPHVMLAKCAEAQALRKAFPAETSQVYTDEEMHQADASPNAASVLVERLHQNNAVSPEAPDAEAVDMGPVVEEAGAPQGPEPVPAAPNEEPQTAEDADLVSRIESLRRVASVLPEPAKGGFMDAIGQIASMKDADAVAKAIDDELTREEEEVAKAAESVLP